MQENIVVSVIMMAYNHEKYIRKALDSVLSQKCNFKIKIVVHDDASTDGTADIIREYAEKYPDIIKAIIQTENQYSKGVKIRSKFLEPELNGKYLAWCECDDYWCDEYKLQKQVDFLETHPDFIAVGHNVRFVDEEGAPYKGIVPKSWTSMKTHVFTLKEVNNHQMFGQLASRVVRNFDKNSEEHRRYDEYKEKCKHMNGDTYMSLYYFLNGKVYVMADVMSCYRKSTSNGSYSDRVLRKNQGLRKIQSLSELVWLGEQYGVKLAYKKEYCKMVFSSLAFYWKTGSQEDKEIYEKCKKANPYKLRAFLYVLFFGAKYKVFQLLSKGKQKIKAFIRRK